MDRLLLKDCYFIKPADGREGLEGYDILIEDGFIREIGLGLNPLEKPGGDSRVIDCSRHVILPGFINTHHHFFQTLTRNLPAVQNVGLFPWLRYLYEVWKHLDDEAVYISSLLAMGELLKTGCTCSTDHLYLYPKGTSGDFATRQFAAADMVGMRFSPTRGSMSLSKKDGGLPPDSVVQSEDEIIADCERVIDTFHDPSPSAMRKVVLAPCRPFSVTADLMRESARLARSRGVRLHTHLAETADEDVYCQTHFGIRPLKLMERCEFIGEDVSYAHGIHFNDEELRVLAETGTQIAHCPSSNMRLGSGICRVREMLDQGVTVSLAVDGSASNDSSSTLRASSSSPRRISIMPNRPPGAINCGMRVMASR